MHKLLFTHVNKDIHKMLIHNYLEQILGSVVKIKILRTLFRFPTKIFTGRELAGLSGKVSHMAVAKSIKSLEKMNLILIEHHGTSNLLKLNKKSHLFQILELLFIAERKTIDKLIDDIKKMLNKKTISCILFGSVARKEENLNSDVELLIIAKNKKLIKDLIYEKQKFFIEKYGIIVNSMVYTKKQFNRSIPFVKTIRKDYIVILGEDILK